MAETDEGDAPATTYDEALLALLAFTGGMSMGAAFVAILTLAYHLPLMTALAAAFVLPIASLLVIPAVLRRVWVWGGKLETKVKA